MINASGEINALLNLIEDPDEEIFKSITQRFVGFGTAVIPYLEEFKEGNEDEDQLQKIDQIISAISLTTLSTSIQQWKTEDQQDILEASTLLSTYINKEFNREEYLFEIEKLRKSIWLELNDYLTPLEEINVINKILFGYYQYKGLETNYTNEKQFDISHLLQEKKANTFALGALYLTMTQMLGISVKPVNIPKQNLLGYIEDPSPFGNDEVEQVLFFIDPFNGQIFTHRDIEIYLKKINSSRSTQSIEGTAMDAYIQQWLIELARCEKEKGNTTIHKQLTEIALILDKD
jgi:regulator of sirC expression with transglutaminase-like and TPR domain